MTGQRGRVVCDLTISADGYSAGPNQTEERPFGDDGGDGWGDGLHAWLADNADENRAEIDTLSAAGQARVVAGDDEIAVQGGATTVNEYLAAGLIDELRLHIAPLTLGGGTRLFEGVPPLNLEQVDARAATQITHVTYRVRA
ncbi:dihydrofolate reductase family protein [Agromyces sp. NPDC049794]|uniref:dihydrofolate reductase family protein n=1 Tax=unclassified Agromyces TaxID=2639701 RepID=UPI0033C314D9